mmetsp:Transcript_25982/g.25706  ORF Transcript_25982/g.25706 Transcript_25982/m.25706 type:complete len:224 (-) Transcript_25982:40-711(-)
MVDETVLRSILLSLQSAEQCLLSTQDLYSRRGMLSQSHQRASMGDQSSADKLTDHVGEVRGDGLHTMMEIIRQSCAVLGQLQDTISQLLDVAQILLCDLDTHGDLSGGLGDQTEVTVGEGYKEYVERRLRQLEGGSVAQATKDYSKPATQKYSKPADGVPTYNTEADAVVEEAENAVDSKKKRKHEKVADDEDEEVEVDVDVVKTKKKKSKKHHHHKEAAEEE